MRRGSSPISTRTNTRPSAWRPRSTSNRACGPWSEGTSRRAGTPKTGKNYRPALELVRLTISRRAYTNDHMRAVAEAVIRVWERRDSVKGLRFVYEPEKLRFFQGRFETL